MEKTQKLQKCRICLAGRDDDAARAGYLGKGDGRHQLLWRMDQNNDVLEAEVSLRFLCWPCPSYVNNPSNATSDLLSCQITAEGSAWGNVWSLLLPWPKIYKSCLRFLSVLLAAFFCLCFEVWICNSDDDEPLKDLSRSRNWEVFGFVLFFFSLGGTLLLGLDVLLGLAYS